MYSQVNSDVIFAQEYLLIIGVWHVTALPICLSLSCLEQATRMNSFTNTAPKHWHLAVIYTILQCYFVRMYSEKFKLDWAAYSTMSSQHCWYPQSNLRQSYQWFLLLLCLKKETQLYTHVSAYEYNVYMRICHMNIEATVT